MRENRLRRALKEGKPTLAIRLHSTWPGIYEVVGETGEFDYVEFAAEYAPWDLRDLEDIARACELWDMSSMIKVDQNPSTFIAQRALGAGIQNVLFADIRSVEDVKGAVSAVRVETPQTGGINGCHMRRCVGYVSECGTKEYVDRMEDALVAIMIEKRQAVENIEEILSVKGLDMVQFGPCDYSLSIGKPGKASEEVKKAERRVIEAALDMGVAPRAEIFETAAEKFETKMKGYLDLGVKHFSVGDELYFLFSWSKERGSLAKKVMDLLGRKNEK